MRLFKKTSIDFMGKRNVWYTVSTTFIFIGLVTMAFKGVTLGIDFLGGTELMVRFEKPIEIGEIRSSIERNGFTGAEIKTFGSPNDILIRTPMQETGTKVGDKLRESLAKSFPNDRFIVLKEDKIGPKIGAELRRNAVYAIFAVLLLIMTYIGFRFHFVYGVAGVISLFHDVLVTLGVIVIFDGLTPLLNLEISQNLMAAFLTLIGFSINDTVVVFDRIRENLKIYKSETLFTVINKSINETLSRTVITSGTVILVLIVLIIFGGEVNRGFAFTFFIGTIVGTYSSIFVASSIVLDWTQYQNRKKKNA